MCVVIVGGGAAGLATAIFVRRRDPALRVLVIDGARRLGAKILVSGGGRCNVTNRVVTAADYWGGDRRIVSAVLSAFPVDATCTFFEEIGVRLHEEAGGKLFPDSNRARSVLDALLAEAGRVGVEVATGECVAAVEREGSGFAVRTPARALRSSTVVLATGGRSLPKSGSDGAGYGIAASLGHTIVDPTPALAPLVLAGSFHAALSGVSHDAAISVEGDGRLVARLRGSLLWTHFGVSGPAALDASRHWHRATLEGRCVRVRLSFLPLLDGRAVEQALLEAAARRPSATLRTALGALLPVAAVADAILEALAVDPALQLAHLPRATRERLAKALVGWDLPVTGSRGYTYAEATAGGVALDEVHRATLRSRVCPGLYLVGEVLDVDGRLGGFNFQWAWSSGWVAARAITTG